MTNFDEHALEMAVMGLLMRCSLFLWIFIISFVLTKDKEKGFL